MKDVVPFKMLSRRLLSGNILTILSFIISKGFTQILEATYQQRDLAFRQNFVPKNHADNQVLFLFLFLFAIKRILD